MWSNYYSLNTSSRYSRNKPNPVSYVDQSDLSGKLRLHYNCITNNLYSGQICRSRNLAKKSLNGRLKSEGFLRWQKILTLSDTPQQGNDGKIASPELTPTNLRLTAWSAFKSNGDRRAGSSHFILRYKQLALIPCRCASFGRCLKSFSLVRGQ